MATQHMATQHMATQHMATQHGNVCLSEQCVSADLEDEGCVDVVFGAGHDPDAATTSVEVTGACDDGDRRAHGLAGVDDTDLERIHCRPPAGRETLTLYYWQYGI